MAVRYLIAPDHNTARFYPELFGIVGATVPDLRGMFLRGTGGNAGVLGQTQIDTMRPITGNMAAMIKFVPGSGMGSGALVTFHQQFNTQIPFNSSGTYGGADLHLDSSRLGSNFSGPETRPVNIAVRYLIRARP